MGKFAKNTRILFLFPKPVKRELYLIENHQAPSERLYGMYELIKQGYMVDYTDVFYEGPFARFYSFMRRCKIKWLPLTVLLKIIRSDVVLIKDDFYTLAALAARLTGKKVIYKDSIFIPPKSLFRKVQALVNIALAHKIIAFSKSQIDLWRPVFPRYANKFEYIFYPLDKQFYVKSSRVDEEKSTLLSVGRDLGRDNHTLHAAVKRLNQSLDLVTLPYLLSAGIKEDPKVAIHQYISYAELFSIYSRSFCSIVPLKKGISYPSGIRAIMEAMALSVPVVAAKTPVLQEYFEDGKDIIYYEPENVDDLINKILSITSGTYNVTKLTRQASETMDRYTIEPYVRRLLVIINRELN